MANPFAATNVVGFGQTTSSAGTSSGIGLDPSARLTMILLDLTSLNGSTGAGTTDVTIQATLDVQTSSWAGNSSASIVWNNISTAHYSSASYPGSGIITISSPIAGLRLSSTTWAGGNATVTLKALQEILA
jgi:hypothetical protein